VGRGEEREAFFVVVAAGEERETEGDRAVLRGELDRVVAEVDEDLTEALGVALPITSSP